mmetsp:Transcript_21072/g.35935  ORF Transcript_21072/g.35935 Transcript_21072/m.35935 type:complete len:221 (+) Transcript_21072:642-1304(+)
MHLFCLRLVVFRLENLISLFSHCWHSHSAQGIGSMVGPVGSDCLDLSVKLDSLLSVEVNISSDGSSVPRKGEHGQRDGDRHIDSHLSHINLVLEFACRCTILGENGTSVPVRILLDHIHGLLECFGLQAYQHRTKYLGSVGNVVGCDIGQNRRTNKIAVFISLHDGPPSIEREGSTFLDSLGNNLLHLILRFAGNERTYIDSLVEAGSDRQLGCGLDKVW